MGVLILRGSGGGGGGGGFNFASGWSGTVPSTDGGTFTISRSGNVDGTVRADERPLRWIPGYTTQQADATYSRDTSSLTAQSGAATQTSIKPYAAAGGAMDQTYNTPSSNACFYSSAGTDGGRVATVGSTGQVFASYYLRYGYNHNSDSSNNKIIRIWNSADTSSALLADMFVQALDIDGNTGGGPSSSSSYSVVNPENTFIQCEFSFQDSSAAGVQDGIWNAAINGGLVLADSVRWTTRVSGQPSDSLKHRVFPPQMSNQPPPASGSHIYIADWYISDTFLHAFISDESTYTTTVYSGGAPLAHERQLQILGSSGNSTSGLNGTVRAGKYSGSLSGKNLWVVSSAGTRYRVGDWS